MRRAQVALEHIRHIIEKLYDHRLIQTVFGHQQGLLGRGQLFIVKGRAGHKLKQRKEHQQNDQQRDQSHEDTFQYILFQRRSSLSFLFHKISDYRIDR